MLLYGSVGLSQQILPWKFPLSISNFHLPLTSSIQFFPYFVLWQNTRNTNRNSLILSCTLCLAKVSVLSLHGKIRWWKRINILTAKCQRWDRDYWFFSSLFILPIFNNCLVHEISKISQTISITISLNLKVSSNCLDHLWFNGLFKQQNLPM